MGVTIANTTLKYEDLISINVRNYPILHLFNILIPQFTIFCSAHLVIIGLAGE